MGTGVCMTAPNLVLCPYCEISWPHDPPHDCPVKRREEERIVSLVKHGTGEVLMDDEGKKVASTSEPTEADKKALAQENAEADGGSSESE